MPRKYEDMSVNALARIGRGRGWSEQQVGQQQPRDLRNPENQFKDGIK